MGVRAKQAILVGVLAAAVVAWFVLSPEGNEQTDKTAATLVDQVERYHDDDSAKGLSRAFHEADPDVRVLSATDLDKIESSADPTVRLVFQVHFNGVDREWGHDDPPFDACYEVVFAGEHAKEPERVLCR
jgi:hypothetical protein